MGMGSKSSSGFSLYVVLVKSQARTSDMYLIEHEVLCSVLSTGRDEVILWTLIKILCLPQVTKLWNSRSAAPSCGKMQGVSIHLQRLFISLHTHTKLLFFKEDWRTKLKAELITTQVLSKIFSSKFHNKLIYKWKGLKCDISLNL